MSDLVKREDAMRVAMWFGRSKEQYLTPFIKKRVMEIPTAIRTKSVKYFDEDEKVWKIGEVIVDEQNR